MAVKALRNGRFWLWAAPLAVWLAFCYWYTNTSGRLAAEEIDRFADQARQNGRPEAAVADLRRFMQEDDGDDFLMVNLLLLAEEASGADGGAQAEIGAAPQADAGLPAGGGDATPDAATGGASAHGDSPAQLMDRYMAHMLPELLKRASHPALVGATVFQAMDLAGIEGAENWSSVGLVRYRSRRDLLEIALDPVFNGKHRFKVASLEKTIAVPMAPDLYFGDLRLLLLLALLSLTGLADALWRRRPAPGRAP